MMGDLSRSIRLVPYVILAGFRRNFTWMSGDKPAIVLSYPHSRTVAAVAAEADSGHRKDLPRCAIG